jgi:hypothetical protein
MVNTDPVGTVQSFIKRYGLPAISQFPETLPSTIVAANENEYELINKTKTMAVIRLRLRFPVNIALSFRFDFLVILLCGFWKIKKPPGVPIPPEALIWSLLETLSHGFLQQYVIIFRL